MAKNVADALQKLLNSGLNRVQSGSIEEVELRFLETAESVLLSLVTDPNAAYYLASKIASQAISELESAISISENILSTLEQPPTEGIDPPAVDRDFVEAKERFGYVLSRVASGASPEEEDVEQFAESYSLFARRQLLPHTETLTVDQYTQRLRSSVDALRQIWSDLLGRLAVLNPKSFFVDSLASELPSYRTLSTLYNRIAGLLDEQELLLSHEDLQAKSTRAEELLNEVAAVISLLNTIKTPTFLQSRELATLRATAYDGEGPTLVGVASIDTFPGGSTAGTVAIHPALNILEVEVTSQQDVVTVTLPSATQPAAVEFTRPVAFGPFPPETVFVITITVLFDFEVVTYTTSFTANDAAASDLSDIYNYLQTLTLSPDKAGYPSLALAATASGDDGGLCLVTYTVVGTVEHLSLELNDPYPKDAGTPYDIWSPYGAQCSITIVCSDPDTTIPSPQEFGTSIPLTTVASSISSALDTKGYANTVIARGDRLEIQTHDVASNDYSYAGVLRSATQPTTVSTGLPVLGVESGPKYGTVSVLAADVADFVVTEAYDSALGKVEIDTVNGLIKLSPAAALPSDFFEKELTLYSRGALSYYTSLELNATSYDAALSLLPKTLEELETLLGKATYSNADRFAARAYVLRQLGTSTKGPLATLRDLLAGFGPVASEGMRGALAALEERGFDYALDLLLLGRVKDAISGAYVSYEEYVRRRFQELGLGIEL